MAGLNYNASMPMDATAPFLVEGGVSDAAQKERSNNPDYVPSDDRIRRLRTRPRRMSNDSEVNSMPRALINEGVEWRAQADQTVLTEKRLGKLDQVRAHIMQTHADGLRRYRNACKYLDNLPREELEPERQSAKTKKALRLQHKGPPITKEEATEQAWQTVVRRG